MSNFKLVNYKKLSGLSSLGQITDTQGLPLPLMVGSGVSEKNPECPVCDPHLNTIAQNLPFAHCSQSRLVCTISGTALNENNQPMMLPNGKSIKYIDLKRQNCSYYRSNSSRLVRKLIFFSWTSLKTFLFALLRFVI